MKVAVVGKTLSGGAGRAMGRITEALSHEAGGTSNLSFKYFLSPSEKIPLSGNNTDFQEWAPAYSMRFKSQVLLNRLVTRNLFRSQEQSLVSFPRVKSGIAERISDQGFDLAHLHWLGDSTMSIREVGNLHIPIVWSLHDMWPIAGVQHYSLTQRHQAGYSRNNRDAHEFGMDLNRQAWNLKKSSWSRPIFFVAPSEWLAKETRNSEIGSKGQVFQIPYPMNTTFWRPTENSSFRDRHSIEVAEQVVIFGAVGGANNRLKGPDVLGPLLTELAKRLSQSDSSTLIRFLVFGEQGQQQSLGNVRLTYVGNVGSDVELRALYSAADLVLVPSLIDNYPLVATEAIACGTPIVAFEDYGPAEIVRQTGAGTISPRNNLAQTASDIVELLEHPTALQAMSKSGIDYAERVWNPTRIREQYLEVYREAIASG